MAMASDLDDEDASIALISGPAGVGKTALAVQLAHEAAPHYPDGQLYLNIRGFNRHGSRPTGAEMLARLLRSLGVAPDRIPSDPDERASLYRSAIAGRRMLLVIDSVRTIGQLRPLLPGDPGCFVLATSRKLLGGLVTMDGAAHLPLAPLTTQQAQELLIRIVGPHRTLPTREAARLARTCGNLPLVLHATAANLIVDTSQRGDSLRHQAGGLRGLRRADLGEDPVRPAPAGLGDANRAGHRIRLAESA
jgi:predicted ATPase